jgi:hypothetical protein
LLQQVFERGTEAGMGKGFRQGHSPWIDGLDRATIDLPRRCRPHFRRDPVAISSWLDAEVGCIGFWAAEDLDVGTRPVEW